MKIMRRKTVRLVVLLIVALSTFIMGVSAFYFYAGAMAVLFQPNQSVLETTKILTPQAVASTIFEIKAAQSSTAITAQYQTSADTDWDCADCVQDEDFGLCVLLSGQYVNDAYGYMLTIPEDVQAMQAPPPAPNHGFVSRIKSDPAAVIEVNAEYNDDDFVEIKAVDIELAYLKSHATNLEILKRTTTRLDKRTASRYVAQYRDTATGRLMIEDKIVSVRKDCPGPGAIATIYVISLQTPAETYDENIRALEKILKRWKELEFDCC